MSTVSASLLCPKSGSQTRLSLPSTFTQIDYCFHAGLLPWPPSIWDLESLLSALESQAKEQQLPPGEFPEEDVTLASLDL